MKIIQFVFRLGSGGAETFVANISRKLVEMGHDVKILTLFKERELASQVYEPILEGKVEIHRLDYNLGFSFKKMKAVCDYIKAEKPDVVHCHLNVIPYIYPIAIKPSQTKFFHTLHSVANHVGTKGLSKTIARWFYKNKKIIPIAISDTCAQSFNDVYRINKVCTIYNCCAEMKKTKLFDVVQNEVNSYKSNSNTPVFIHVARYNPLKRQDILVRAFNELYNEGIDFILLVIGREFDTCEAKPIVEMACEKIHFLGQKGNVSDYLFCSNAFCLTSDYEGLPISLLEAFSAGVVPICTPVGGIPDVVVDGVSGYLSRDKSEKAYVDAVKRYLKTPIDKNKLISIYKSRYSVDTCVSNYLIEFNK